MIQVETEEEARTAAPWTDEVDLSTTKPDEATCEKSCYTSTGSNCSTHVPPWFAHGVRITHFLIFSERQGKK
eukprot:m.87822 g.87822  ORF g.87822 m.87822 type:complete len:72 (+) comp14517_c0_seq6:121-336(+)